MNIFLQLLHYTENDEHYNIEYRFHSLSIAQYCRVSTRMFVIFAQCFPFTIPQPREGFYQLIYIYFCVVFLFSLGYYWDLTRFSSHSTAILSYQPQVPIRILYVYINDRLERYNFDIYVVENLNLLSMWCATFFQHCEHCIVETADGKSLSRVSCWQNQYDFDFCAEWILCWFCWYAEAIIWRAPCDIRLIGCSGCNFLL